MRLDRAIADVQEAEEELAKRLRVVGERHAVEHDLYHLGHALARQCEEHLARLAPFAERYGAPPGNGDVAEPPRVLESLRHKGTEPLGRAQASGLLLLRDLRELYLAAQASEVTWVILGQAAKAVRDVELIAIVERCHEEAEHRGMWLRTRIKDAAPQVLASG